MRKKDEFKTRIDLIAEKGQKRLDDYYNRNLKKSKYNKNADYQKEVRLDGSLKV
jgi:hypothetical protein